MKIAYITMQFPVPSETFAAVEIRALRRAGAEVTVLTYRGAPSGAKAMLAERGLADLPLEQGGVMATLKGLTQVVLRPSDSAFLIGTVLRVCRRQPLHLLKALALVPRSLALQRRLEILKPDVVHLFWGHYPSLLGLLLVNKPSAPTVTMFLGAYDLRLRLPLSAALARRVPAIFTHANANRPDIAALGGALEKVHTFYRGIDVPCPLPQPPKKPGTMVTAGRLIPLKRVDDCLRILALVRQTHPEAELTVLGGGPLRDALERTARSLGLSGHVHFKGHVSHTAVFEQLAQSAVYLTMSDTDHLPNAVKEAMVYRCVPVATRTQGMEELVADGTTGFVVDQGDTARAAACINDLFAHHTRTAAMAQAAQEFVRDRFGIDALTRQRLALWQRLAGERQAARTSNPGQDQKSP